MSRFSYENQGSHSFLVYSLDHLDELDQIGLGMINNNKIQNILPITFNQFDSERYLRYNISSTVSLQKFLGGTVTKKRALNIFKSICDVLLSAEDYLLDGSLFVLNPQYIFVDSASGVCSLVYLAIQNYDNEVDFSLFFKRLIISIKSDQNDDCAYVAAILNYLNTNDHFSLHEFRKLLNRLGVSGDDNLPTMEKTLDVGVPAPRKRNAERKSGGSVLVVPPARPSSEQPERGSTARKMRQVGSEQKVAPVISAEKETPAPAIPVAKGRLTFQIPDMGQAKSDARAIKEKKRNTEPQGDSEEIKLMWLLQHFSSDNLARYKAQKNDTVATGAKKPKQENKRKKEKKRKNGKNLVLVLTSLDERNPNAWVIDRDRFTIGRRKTNSGVIADIFTDVSREHCSVVRENGEFYVVDENSRFGTIVDGVACTAQTRSGPLRDGSVIELPGIRFRAEFKER